MFILLIILILLIFIIIFREKFMKLIRNKKFLIIVCIIAVLVIGGVIAIKSYKNRELKASKEDIQAIEQYIHDKKGLDLKVQKSVVVLRGDFGINPGTEYIFYLKDKQGKKYEVRINTYSSGTNLENILNNYTRNIDIQEVN